MNAERLNHMQRMVMEIMRERYQGADGVAFVRAIPDIDMLGEDIVRLLVVFDSDKPALQRGDKPALMLRVLAYLRDEDLPHFPMPYFIGKSEWPAYAEGFAVAV